MLLPSKNKREEKNTLQMGDTNYETFDLIVKH